MNPSTLAVRMSFVTNKGTRTREVYTCAKFHDVQYTAPCVFDFREAAVEHVESLSEN